MTEIQPKQLIAAHGKPAAPLFPSANEVAVVDPMRTVKAEISRKPLPSADGSIKDHEDEVEFDDI